MNRVIFIFLLFSFFVLRSNAQSDIGTNRCERKVLKLINSLPELIKENQRRRKTHITILLRAYIQNTPTKAHNHYKVTISEIKGERLFTYDWYEVNARTYQISYDDIVTGKTISLKEWRLQQSHPPKK